MARISVSTLITAGPDAVWADLRHIERHVEWMQDAVAISFTSEAHEGVGTSFDCDTRVGPLRLTDRMVVTAWDPGAAMGITHEGAVKGSGRFTLDPDGDGTRFSWTEELRFPWWLGGALGAAVGARVLRLVWQRNLGNLRRRFG